MEHNVEIHDIVYESEIDTNIDSDYDVQCTAFKSANNVDKNVSNEHVVDASELGKKASELGTNNDGVGEANSPNIDVNN